MRGCKVRVPLPNGVRISKTRNLETSEINFVLGFRTEQMFHVWVDELEQASFEAGVESTKQVSASDCGNLQPIVPYAPISGTSLPGYLRPFGIPVGLGDHRDYSINGILLNLASRVARLEAQLGLQSAEPQSAPKP